MPKPASTRPAYKMLTCIYLCRTLLFFAPYADFFIKITTVSRASRLSRITNDKEIMAGFEERFEYFKYITNHCLQYALECGYIKINDDLSVTVLVDNNLQIDCRLSKSINLASQLHKIFTRNVINTYYAFGIYKL